MMKNFLKTEFSAIPENEKLARQIAASFLMNLNPTVEEICDIKTSVSEAVTNSIIHAYRNNGGSIHMELKLTDKIFEVEIRDLGVGIDDVDKAREPLYTSQPELERSGMGFTVMESFMDYVDVISEKNKGTTVIMRKTIGETDG